MYVRDRAMKMETHRRPRENVVNRGEKVRQGRRERQARREGEREGKREVQTDRRELMRRVRIGMKCLPRKHLMSLFLQGTGLDDEPTGNKSV